MSSPAVGHTTMVGLFATCPRQDHPYPSMTSAPPVAVSGRTAVTAGR